MTTNHIHFIVQNVGADLRVCPSDANADSHVLGEHVDSPLRPARADFQSV